MGGAMSNVSATVDIVILGGGVSGLWSLNRLRQSGYNAILIESTKLGSGQTRYAQGIIHGGTKYALTGQMNSENCIYKELGYITINRTDRLLL